MIVTANKTENKMLQVRIEKKVLELAKEKAEKTGLNVSQVVRKLLEDYVNDLQSRLTF